MVLKLHRAAQGLMVRDALALSWHSWLGLTELYSRMGGTARSNVMMGREAYNRWVMVGARVGRVESVSIQVDALRVTNERAGSVGGPMVRPVKGM